MLDYAFAWLLWLSAIAFILVIEISHPPGAILDIPFFWLVVAMVNFLRLRNGYANVPGLMTTCVGANLVTLTMEVARWGLSDGRLWKAWGPFTTIAAVALFMETVFSILRKNDPGAAMRS
jgi:hypothetical protein